MDFRATLLEETGALGEVVRTADPEAPVPTCPGWTMNQLLKHVGRGHLWSAQIIAERRLDALDPREVRGGKPPGDADGAIEWLDASAKAVIAAVDRVGAETRVWTFNGPKPAGWWIRRRVHEATVHRADAVLAVGGDYQLPAELAADGISEWITLATAGADRRHPPLPRGSTLHLHATDVGLGPTGEWTITNDEDGLQWSHAHAKGDAAVRGSAVGLFLALTRRRSTADAGLEVFGDEAVWNAWLDGTPF
ncbi:maleylpyruvate isomerase family mycothiol-dependent enzyme [Mycobacterium yunnanensis]|uniref:Maleylpyruvate isomerase family mycothiol-dependent enzyme n=1 Tax=Mycobacterium yunnanensis TaxID=368477 RepID=A0A9X3C0W2_9MYCO|nr:maleylpyruvate isomerase family mycothiol-dependent enzyme [Mycobacterium yunnanensis]MCV7420983.1 maleylpyruvate isomerase family mycothiol-dependent enzyme [Mycobacterium yunnanensis]